MTTNSAAQPAGSTLSTCRICGSGNADDSVMLREMMFGTRKEFEYFRCQDCDTLQISTIPDDLGSYYPDNYYSQKPKPPTLKERLKVLLKGHDLPPWAIGLNRDSSVLDIGSGDGGNLVRMKNWGFRHVEGYDPYCTPFEINGVRISNIRPEGKKFDIIMMHHSIEHVPDPIEVLADVNDWLAPDGRLIIRIPVRQGWAWREYGVHWAHLDPPRHLYHWTVDGFTKFAETHGFELLDQGFDGTLFSLAYSPLFANDVPMNSPDAVIPDGLWQRAAELNAAGDGDSAWFVFRRQEPGLLVK